MPSTSELRRPSVAPTTSLGAPKSVSLFRRCLSRTQGFGLARRHHAPPHIHLRGDASAKRPLVITAAAAAATGAFAEDNGGGAAALKRRALHLLSSPYDKEIWGVALPALVAMLLEPVMNALNAGLVGHLGTHQLSAVSLGSLAVALCTFFYTFLLFLTVPEIAAAVAKKSGDEEVSCIAAKSLWIAGVCGVFSAGAMFLGAEAIVGVLKPPEAVVAAFAADYIRIRSLAIPAVLLGFVATGVFRGFKDTRTPLLGAVLSAGASLGLNVLFLYVLRWGVVGGAVATAAAQLVSCGLLLGALLRGGRVQARHLRRPPPLAAMTPTLKLGAVLGARNIISFGMVLYASALSIRMGSSYQAGFEVVRQVWLLAIQFFECLNVATQALCASYLGNEDRATARVLLNRLLLLAVVVGGLAGAAVWALHGPIIAFFTRDPAVVAHVMEALPLMCVFFPIDAAAAIMDGSLLAAKQSNYMSAVQIAGSFVQYSVMSYLAATGNVTSFTVWASLKILILIRVVCGVARNYCSPQSGYMPAQTTATAAAIAAVVAAEPVTTQVEERAAAAAAAAAPVVAATTPPPPPRAQEPARLSPSRGATAVTQAAAAAEPASTIAVPATATATAAALQSFEDDVMALACVACTAATDMNPDMLSLKQRQQSGSVAAAAFPAAGGGETASIDEGSGHGNGNGSGAGKGAEGAPASVAPAVSAVASSVSSIASAG